MLKRLLALMCALAITAPAAAAQDDEVFVDPGSPSGKEYAIPIDRARQEAAPTNRTRPGAKPAPLFGEGVDGTGNASSATATKTAQDRRRNQSSEAARRRRDSRDSATAGADAKVEAGERQGVAAREAALSRAQSLRAQADMPEGGMGVGGIIAAGIGVLLIGGLAGLWLRRRTAT